MSIVTILALAAGFIAFTFLLIALRPPPLYSDPEALPKRKDLNAEKEE